MAGHHLGHLPCAETMLHRGEGRKLKVERLSNSKVILHCLVGPIHSPKEDEPDFSNESECNGYHSPLENHANEGPKNETKNGFRRQRPWACIERYLLPQSIGKLGIEVEGHALYHDAGWN